MGEKLGYFVNGVYVCCGVAFTCFATNQIIMAAPWSETNLSGCFRASERKLMSIFCRHRHGCGLMHCGACMADMVLLEMCADVYHVLILIVLLGYVFRWIFYSLLRCSWRESGQML